LFDECVDLAGRLINKDEFTVRGAIR
jgi:hypothetical protein